MAKKQRAVILHGASADRPDEADTIVQANMVADSLRRMGWTSEIIAMGLDLSKLERRLTPRPGIVFNLVESLNGDGRLVHLVPAVLEHFGVAFTGAPAAAHFTTTNKPIAKRLLRGAGLATPDWIDAGGENLSGRINGQMIVKAASEDASLGIDSGSVVPVGQIHAEIARRSAAYGGEWFAESFVDGREFNVGILAAENGLEVLPIAEILFVDYPADRPRIVDYEAKWIEDSFAYSHTPRQFDLPAADARLLGELGRLAIAAFNLFGLKGYGRVDFRVDGTGRPWILEVNANPCLAPEAGFAVAAAEAGLTTEEVIARIVNSAIHRSARAAA